MGRPVVHFEIGCKDSRKTQEFYKQLFDWKVDAMGPAAMIAAEAGGITGHITALGHEPHHYTIFYVDVDDVGAYLEKAKSLGGKMLVPQVINAFHSEGARGRFRRIVGYQERADKAQAFGNRENRAPRLHDHEGCA